MFKGNQYYLQKVDTDFHFVETCAPYKIRDDDGMLFTVYTIIVVNGTKPKIKKKNQMRRGIIK